MKLLGYLVNQKATAVVLCSLLSYTTGTSAGALPIYRRHSQLGVSTTSSSSLSVVLSFSCLLVSPLLFWPIKEATALSSYASWFGFGGSEPVDQPKEEQEKKTGNSNGVAKEKEKSPSTKAKASASSEEAATVGNNAEEKEQEQDAKLPPPPDGMARLSDANNLLFPLVGMGMGGLHADDVAILLEGAPEQIDNVPLMIDTSHKSGTEADVARGILAREAKLGPLLTLTLPSPSKTTMNRRTYHIVTKVWYTHLGYERTKLSVMESLRHLKPVLNKPDANNAPTQFEVRITMLLHWPKCRDDFEWTECQAEEAALPNDVKVYPSPLAQPNKAYLDSWRALEDLFSQGRLDAIGISNFEVADLKTLLRTAKIQPHIHQMSIWSMYHEPELMDTMRNASTSMVYQAYNVMQVFQRQGADAPGAYRFMWELGQVNGGFAPHTMGLASMIQRHISVIPSTRNWDHLNENAVGHLLQIPTLNDADTQLVYDAIGCLIDQQDNEYFRDFSHMRHEEEELDHYREKERRETVETRFVNRVNRPVQLFLFDPHTGERHPQTRDVPPGHEATLRSHRDQIFHAYELGADIRNDRPLKEFQVRGDPGQTETFHVEL
jgi:diketogulonate reductase-like aldo/keto reductase